MPMENYWSARVKNPKLFKEDSFRWKKLGKGISALMGKLKNDGDTMVIQAYRFDKSKYSKAEAKKWLKKEGIKYTEFATIEDIVSNYATIIENKGGEKQVKDPNVKPENNKLNEVMRDFFNNTVLYEGGKEPTIPESEFIPDFLNNNRNTVWTPETEVKPIKPVEENKGKSEE